MAVTLELESELVSMGPCAACGSSDANGLYTDDHTYCFSCHHHVQGDAIEPTNRNTRIVRSGSFLSGEVRALNKRGLSEATCRRFGYTVGALRSGVPVQIATYRDAGGAIVAQHTRDAEKNFGWLGDSKLAALFGESLCKGTGRRIVVTEGEIDAMSVSQAFGNTWDVVSLPGGAAGALKACKKALPFLEGYDEVVIWFDDDESGRAAVESVVDLFTPGRCKVATSPRKDANDVLMLDGVKAVTSAVYNARVYRPDGIVSLSDIRERVLTSPAMGRPYPFAGLTAATFGRRPGDVIGLGGGTGCGKSDWFSTLIEHDVMTLGLTVGVLSLEQDVGDTGKRIAGKMVGKNFHLPDGSWTQDELVEAYDRLEATQRLHLYDAYGSLEWEVIKGKIRYLVVSLGCQHIFLDHLTALASTGGDERRTLELIMAEASGLAKSLNFVLHYISHLASPEGASHEEGGRVTSKQFKGSRAIAFWSHTMFGLERNTQDNDKKPTVLRVLKHRFYGSATGKTFGLAFDEATGLLTECKLDDPSDIRSDESECPF